MTSDGITPPPSTSPVRIQTRSRLRSDGGPASTTPAHRRTAAGPPAIRAVVNHGALMNIHTCLAESDKLQGSVIFHARGAGDDRSRPGPDQHGHRGCARPYLTPPPGVQASHPPPPTNTPPTRGGFVHITSVIIPRIGIVSLF